MNFKYTKNYSNDEASILLYDDIGYNPMTGKGIDGQAFADEIYFLQEMGVKRINVHINSAGGSVIDGQSIFAAIAYSNVICNTYVDGIAASIAAVIALAGKRITMVDYGRIMIHDPYMQVETKKDKIALEEIRLQLVSMISNKTGKTQEEISTMMNKETWLNSQDALSMGFIDTIYNTKKNINIPANATSKALHSIFNKINKYENMDLTKLNALLDIKDEASEDIYSEKIQELLNTIETLKKESEASKLKQEEIEKSNTDLKEKVAVSEAKEKVAQDNLAIEMVESAVKIGKIKPEFKDKMIEKAKNDFTFVKDLIEVMPTPAIKLHNPTNIIKSEISNEKKDWTIRDWEKNDPKGLTKLKSEDKDSYNELFNAFYKKA